jgi:hypothetical protein
MGYERVDRMKSVWRRETATARGPFGMYCLQSSPIFVPRERTGINGSAGSPLSLDPRFYPRDEAGMPFTPREDVRVIYANVGEEKYIPQRRKTTDTDSPMYLERSRNSSHKLIRNCRQAHQTWDESRTPSHIIPTTDHV